MHYKKRFVKFLWAIGLNSLKNQEDFSSNLKRHSPKISGTVFAYKLQIETD